MKIVSDAMQKSRTNGLLARGATLTGRPVPPILLVYVLPVRHRSDVLLLLSDADVWVGRAKFFQPTRGEAGGFCFHPLSKTGAGAGRIFGIFRTRIYGGHTYDYRDRK